MTGLLPCSLRAPLHQDLQVSTRKLPIFTLSVSEEFLLFHYICYIFNKHIYTYLHNIYYLIAYWLYFNLLIWNVSLITSSWSYLLKFDFFVHCIGHPKNYRIWSSQMWDDCLKEIINTRMGTWNARWVLIAWQQNFKIVKI